MPASSKKQQKFMGIVRSIQKGEAPAGKFSKAAQKAAKSMEKSSVKKYAKTKHDDLPTKKESTAAYKKTLQKIARDKQLKMISKKDKDMLIKIAKMMKESLSASQFKAAHKKFKDTGELPPHLKKLVKDLDKVKVKHKVKNIVVPGLEWMSKIKESLEEAERDYKDEYKKFQSSTKSKKYRAELNKYNRKKGTYGNGDGKDASHKGGKIVGFESQSKNRGRAEKSRLKKENVNEAGMEINKLKDAILMFQKKIKKQGRVTNARDEDHLKNLIKVYKQMGGKGVKEAKLNENPAAIAAGVRAAMARAKEKELSSGGGKKVKVSTALANKSHPKHKQAKGIIQRIKDKAKSMLAKSKKKKAEPKKQSKSDANFYARQFGGTSESINENDKVKVLKHLIKRGNNPKDAKKDVQKLYNKVNKMYKNASPSKKAEIISSLSAYKMESVNEANNIDKVKDIVKNKQFKRIGGVIIDMQTANAIMQVHKALSGANKKKYEKLSISKMASIAYKLIK